VLLYQDCMQTPRLTGLNRRENRRDEGAPDQGVYGVREDDLGLLWRWWAGCDIRRQ
jgi:hypothetical protein